MEQISASQHLPVRSYERGNLCIVRTLHCGLGKIYGFHKLVSRFTCTCIIVYEHVCMNVSISCR